MIENKKNKYDISCVMPAFNEEWNIAKAVDNAFEALEKFASNYEVIIVDDGSSDGTFDVLMKKREFNDRLKVIRHGSNKGYGAALKTGFSSASYDLIFYTDSDNQFDIKELPLLLGMIDNADIVVGYRKDRKDPKLRLFTSSVYNSIIARTFGLSLRDVNCAFKLFRKQVFEKINIESTDFFVDAEIMIKAQKLNMRIFEAPVTHLPRTAGNSTVKSSDIVKTLKAIKALKQDKGI